MTVSLPTIVICFAVGLYVPEYPIWGVALFTTIVGGSAVLILPWIVPKGLVEEGPKRTGVVVICALTLLLVLGGVAYRLAS